MRGGGQAGICPTFFSKIPFERVQPFFFKNREKKGLFCVCPPLFSPQSATDFYLEKKRGAKIHSAKALVYQPTQKQSRVKDIGGFTKNKQRNAQDVQPETRRESHD